jgi:hypothetical protein
MQMLNLLTGFIESTIVFCECRFDFALSNFEKTGMDVLFYGQDYYDTLAILSKREDFKGDVGDLMTNQKLLGNKELLLSNLSELTLSL